MKCKFAWKGIHSKIWSRIRIPDKIPRLRYVNRHVSTERKSCVNVARAEPETFERVEGKKGERERKRGRGGGGREVKKKMAKSYWSERKPRGMYCTGNKIKT